jgi:predicted transcriptional regulator
MAKLSRSKQPAFDPAELEDLIFTPAVGSGVGSHLVRAPAEEPDKTTVVTTELATVGRSAGERDMTTVAMSAASAWVTETGEMVPPSRVRPIRAAADALSTAELAVYQALWKCGSGVSGGDRVCQAGYDYLVRNTRLSRKTIQRVVDRLLEKEYMAIDKPADIYLRTSTVYRVFGEQGVLDRQAARGRFHVVKIGPGFLYVRDHSSHA